MPAADTYNCPNQDVIPLLPCLGKSEVDSDVYAVIDTITDRVNQFLAVMSLSPVDKIKRATDANNPAFDCHVLNDGGSYEGTAFDGIGTYINMLINTGYVYKQAKNSSGELYPVPPSTPAEIEFLKSAECEAFWQSWDEIYACMRNPDTGVPLDSAMRRRVFEACPTPASEECFNKKAWQEMLLSLRCMADYKCYPACQCPICSSGGCQPCGKCLTLQVAFGGGAALVKLTPGSGCIGSMSGTAPILDGAGQLIDAYPIMDYTIYLAKGYLTYSIRIWDALYDPGGGGSKGRWLYHQPALYNFGTSEPDDICSDVPADPGTIFTDRSEQVYWYDVSDPLNPNTTGMGNISISMAIGFPICSHPWPGVRDFYHINMGDIPMCINCGYQVALPQNGNLTLSTGGPLTLTDPSLSHLGRDFNAEITFDDPKCAFKLELSCVGYPGLVYWRGFLMDCGGPAGTYVPEVTIPPSTCPSGSITVSEGHL